MVYIQPDKLWDNKDLPKGILEAVKQISDSVTHLKHVQVTIQGRPRYQIFFDHFNSLLQESAKTTGQLSEPPEQEMDDRGGSQMPSDDGDTEAMKQEIDAIEDAQEKDRLVMVENIPVGMLEGNLRNLCEQLPVKVTCIASLSNQALVKCMNEKDAKTLTQFKFKSLRFKRIDDMNLSRYEGELSSKQQDFFSKMGKIEKLKRALGEIGVALKHVGTTFKVEALTNIQYLFAQQILNSELKACNVVDKLCAQESHFEILKLKMSEDFHKLMQYGGKITYDSGDIILSYPETMQEAVVLRLKGFLKEIEDTQVEEFIVGETFKQDMVESWCQEISKKGQICVYSPETRKVIMYCDRYEDLKLLKHQLKIKTGDIKVTGHRQRNFRENRVFSHDADATVVQKAEINKHFMWKNDASNVQVYKTDEGIIVSVYKASILKLPVDCIVNAANGGLNHGGGVARVIADAAGAELLQEGKKYINKYGHIQVGECCSTTAGKLPFICVIHTVGPAWTDYQPYTREKVMECMDHLFKAVINTFKMADDKKLKKIAFPAISSAIFGVPEEMCIYTYVKAIQEYSREKKGEGLTEIHFVDINLNMVQKVQVLCKKVFMENSQQDLDIQQFVKQKSMNANWSQNVNVDNRQDKTVDKGLSAAEFQILEYDNGEDKMFAFGNSGTIIISNQDIFIVKAESINCVVDNHGNAFSNIAIKLRNKISSEYEYKKSIKKAGPWFCNSVVFITDGFGCKFNHILHTVLPRDIVGRANMKHILAEAYNNIFLQLVRGKETSVAMGVIGTETKESARICAEVFKKFCAERGPTRKNVMVHLVCYEREKYEVVYQVFHEFAMKNSSGDVTALHNNRASGLQMNQAENSVTNKIPSDFASSTKSDSEENCVICMERINNPKSLICGHTFCTDCIEQSLKFKQVCPTCGKVCGKLTGDQPRGTMTDYYEHGNLAGYEGYGRIRIAYNIPSGKQENHHPNPGKWYDGIVRIAYLPANREGHLICEMLKIAFHRKLVFTIGRSVTTAREGVVTWNDIHHKTNPTPHGKFGYPDDTYLMRVKDELAAKGITEKDIAKDVLESINKQFHGHV